MSLTDIDLIRYGRQIVYPQFGEYGQLRLKKSHVVVVGAGGLGSHACTQLASAGVGHITVIDRDKIELSDLNRQILYCEEDIGKDKASCAAQNLVKLNSSIKITAITATINMYNAGNMIKEADVVVDATDNLQTRLALNSACVAEKTPFIYGGVHGLICAIMTIIPEKTPCLACIFTPSGKTPAVIPVFGAVPAVAASFQVAEVIKLLVGFGSLLTGKMLYLNLETMDFSKVDIALNADCGVCGGVTRLT